MRAGLTEERAAMVKDDYRENVTPAQTAALELTDRIVQLPARFSDDLQATLLKHYTSEQIGELAMGVGLFMSMSKVLITLGLEPDEMSLTTLPTPGS